MSAHGWSVQYGRPLPICTARGCSIVRAFNAGWPIPYAIFTKREREGEGEGEARSIRAATLYMHGAWALHSQSVQYRVVNPICNFLKVGHRQCVQCAAAVYMHGAWALTGGAFNTGAAYTHAIFTGGRARAGGRERGEGSRAGKGTRKQGVEQTFYSLCAGALLGDFTFRRS